MNIIRTFRNILRSINVLTKTLLSLNAFLGYKIQDIQLITFMSKPVYQLGCTYYWVFALLWFALIL